jgi:hypothetical protein
MGTFEVDVEELEELDVVSKFLEALGSSLRRLSLNFSGFDGVSGSNDIHLSHHKTLLSDVPVEKINLNHNTSLTSLEIRSPLSKPVKLASQVNQLLSQITSPNMQRLNLGVLVDNERELETMDWPLLAKVLSRPQFETCAIGLFVRGSARKDRVMDKIKAKLAEHGSREILLSPFIHSFTCVEANVSCPGQYFSKSHDGHKVLAGELSSLLTQLLGETD